MITPYEVRFAEAFLASLVEQNVSSFPFGDKVFTSGVRAISQVARESSDPVDKYQIGDLFNSSPVCGDYSYFLSVLNYLNGKRISLENFRLVHAKIKIPKDAARIILDKTPQDLRNFAQIAAKTFKKTLPCEAYA